MTRDRCIELFSKFEDDEYGEFEKIENPPSRRHDLCAFILLDKLVPERGYNRDRTAREMVVAAEHDEIWLDVNMECFYERATEADILYLVRCGVRFDNDTDSLALFV